MRLHEILEHHRFEKLSYGTWAPGTFIRLRGLYFVLDNETPYFPTVGELTGDRWEVYVDPKQEATL